MSIIQRLRGNCIPKHLMNIEHGRQTMAQRINAQYKLHSREQRKKKGNRLQILNPG